MTTMQAFYPFAFYCGLACKWRTSKMPQLDPAKRNTPGRIARCLSVVTLWLATCRVLTISLFVCQLCILKLLIGLHVLCLLLL